MPQPFKYSWNPHDYAKHSSPQFEWANELIPKLRLSGNQTLLDIGCGDGRVTTQIASSLPQGLVVGIDNSEEMINLARKNFPRRAFRNITFLVLDARQLNFHGQFDRVFSNAALHWIIDHRPVLKGVQRSLKQNGKLLLQMGGKGNAQSMLALLDELMAENRWEKYFEDFTFPYGFYEPNQYQKWLREAGLKPDRVELLQKDMRLLGKEGLAGWFRTTWLPYTEKLPIGLKTEFIEEIVDRYLSLNKIDASGYVHVAMVRLEVEATK